MKTLRFPNAVLAISLAISAGLAACGDDKVPQRLTKAELMDPTTCQACHPQQFRDWSGSMHAYAAEDPVFLAMNQRAQRETNGTLGSFCVKCHAPVALAEGLTDDGLNLPELPAPVKGVTCYFCHSALAVEGSHNNPLKLATDGTLFGPFADPVASTPHKSAYSALFDMARPESSAACGACHDIVNQHGAAVERTFSEWQATLFADPKVGQTCVRCHMNQSKGPASTTSTGKIRSLGSHALPGVDVALTDFPQVATQTQLVQNLLDSTLTGTLCLTDDLKIEVSLDNVAAGHSVPSGATPDRRLWAEVVAYSGDRIAYQSGVVPVGQSVETIVDPDLWLIRDCLTDQDDKPVHMFWEAAKVTSNLIPGPVKATISDPSTFTRSHIRFVYPRAQALAEKPDRITLRVLIKPIGDEIIADLIASGDLLPEFAQRVPPFEFAQTKLEWTAATGKVPIDTQTRSKVPGLSCVTSGSQYFRLPTVAVTHARCAP
ncbi:MAG: hypothetical protein H7X95_05095 [Deltaproteobacteria bacterium]|nr:hypothetical protein [Deltaproteobacteria bacterium]